MLPLKGAQFPSLIRELVSHTPKKGGKKHCVYLHVRQKTAELLLLPLGEIQSSPIPPPAPGISSLGAHPALAPNKDGASLLEPAHIITNLVTVCQALTLVARVSKCRQVLLMTGLSFPSTYRGPAPTGSCIRQSPQDGSGLGSPLLVVGVLEVGCDLHVIMTHDLYFKE